jgi:hypothetical protein
MRNQQMVDILEDVLQLPTTSTNVQRVNNRGARASAAVLQWTYWLACWTQGHKHGCLSILHDTTAAPDRGLVERSCVRSIKQLISSTGKMPGSRPGACHTLSEEQTAP